MTTGVRWLRLDLGPGIRVDGVVIPSGKVIAQEVLDDEPQLVEIHESLEDLQRAYWSASLTWL